MPRNDSAIDRKSLEHPNAFLSGDGRTLYRYEIPGDGTTGKEKDVLILPKPMEEMKEQDYYDLPISLTETTFGRLPQNLTVEFKDPQWAGYWFNKKAGGGARVSVARTLGFVPAKIEDLKAWYSTVNDKDGAVEQHDLVLMKIHKAKLYGKYKQWMDMAKTKGSIGGYKSAAEDSLSPSVRENMDYYHTPQALREKQGLGAVEHLKEVNR